MTASRRVVPVALVAAYGAFYAWGWYAVWRTHQTDPGDGLEYLGVLLSTLPWCVVLAPVAALVPESGVPVVMTGWALVNAALLWWGSSRLLVPRRGSVGPDGRGR